MVPFIVARGEDKPTLTLRRAKTMYVDFKKDRDHDRYELHYSYSETGVKRNPTIFTCDTLQDAGLFIRYMLGKDMDKDQRDEIELLICKYDFENKDR